MTAMITAVFSRFIHTSGGLVEFKPTSKGLHALDLHDNPNAAHLLVISTHPNKALCMSTLSTRITKVSPQNKSSGPTRHVISC
jgi:hypothetical protein